MSHVRLSVTVTAAVAACFLPAFAGPAHAVDPDGLITNGGFEEPDVPTGAWILPVSIPGWQPTNGCRIEVQDNTPSGGAAQSGDQFAELDSDCSGGIQQTFPTEPGLRYVTRYWYSPRNARFSDAGEAYNNLLEVRWNGAVVQTQQRENTTLQNDWTEHTTEQVATGPQSTIAFTDGSTDPRGLDDSLGVYVDTVSVVPHYDLCLLYDDAKTNHAGSAVPVKLRLCDTDGDNLSDPSVTVTATGLTNLDTGATAPLAAAGNANPGGAFRYDAGLAGYIYNLKTTGLSDGTWALGFAVSGSDGVSYSTTFVVR